MRYRQVVRTRRYRPVLGCLADVVAVSFALSIAVFFWRSWLGWLVASGYATGLVAIVVAVRSNSSRPVNGEVRQPSIDQPNGPRDWTPQR